MRRILMRRIPMRRIPMRRIPMRMNGFVLLTSPGPLDVASML